MKYLSLAPFAALAAIMQAITIYSYDQDAMAVAGQIFFPVLFTLMALYLMLKNPGGSAKLTLVMAIELVISALTFVGSSQKIAALYPSIIVYYVALAALALEVAARIADTPKRAKASADGNDTPETDSPAAEQEHDSADEHDPDETTRQQQRGDPPHRGRHGQHRSGRARRPQHRKTRCGKTCRFPKNHPHRDARRTQPQSTRTPRQPPHSHHEKIRQAHHRHGLTGPCRPAAAHTLAATSRTPPSSRAEPHHKTPAPPGNTHTHTPTR